MDILLSAETEKDVAPKVLTKSIPRLVPRSPSIPASGKCLPNTSLETLQTSAQKEVRQKKNSERQAQQADQMKKRKARTVK